MAVCRHDARIGVHPRSHEQGAGDEWAPSSPAVDVDERKDGHEDVDDVLYGGGYEVGVAGETGHAEDVCDLLTLASTLYPVPYGKDDSRSTS